MQICFEFRFNSIFDAPLFDSHLGGLKNFQASDFARAVLDSLAHSLFVKHKKISRDSG